MVKIDNYQSVAHDIAMNPGRF